MTALEHFLQASGFTETEMLGEGSSGTVLVAYSSDEERDVALKIIPRSLPESKVEDNFLSELHDNRIINRYRSLCQEDFLVIVMEMMDHDLMDTIEALGSVKEKEARAIFYEICRGVLCCHSKNIAHLDIKPENILLNANESRVVLTDFGTAIKFQPETPVSLKPIGTFFYCPPEITRKVECLPDRADIWSLGILLHVILTGTWPFVGETYEEACQNASEGHVQCLENSLSSEALSLITHMLKENPRERYNIVQVLEHQWFSPVARRASEMAHRLDFDLEPAISTSPRPVFTANAPASSGRRTSAIDANSLLAPRIASLNMLPTSLRLSKIDCSASAAEGGLKTPRKSDTLTPRLVKNESSRLKKVKDVPEENTKSDESTQEESEKEGIEVPLRVSRPKRTTQEKQDRRTSGLGNLFKQVRKFTSKIK